jgi:tetratricopeptide (TPR) repeat protein
VITDRGERMMARDANIDSRVFMLYLYGRAELRKEHGPKTLDSAESWFREAIEIDADFARAWAGLCDTYLARYIQSGNEEAYYEQGEQTCRQAIALEASSAEMHVALGNLYRISGELDAALLEFRNALSLAPEHYDAIYGLAQVLEAQGDLDNAEAQYKTLIRIEPGYWHGRNALGFYYYENDRYAEAASNFRRVTTLDPENALAHNNLGAAQYMQGDYAGAAASWEESVRLRPSNLVLSNIGLAAYYAGDFERAARMQRQALAEAPEDYRLWSRLGDAERQRGSYEDARDAYNEAMRFASRATELNPVDVQALRFLSLIYSHSGDDAAAVAAIERARELQPDASITSYYASKVYLNAGDIDRAYAELDEALARGYSKEIAEADPDLAPLMGPRTIKTNTVES